jgi:hypothetical protein
MNKPRNAGLFHGLPRNAVLFHGLPRNAVLFHGLPRNAVLFHQQMGSGVSSRKRCIRLAPETL